MTTIVNGWRYRNVKKIKHPQQQQQQKGNEWNANKNVNKYDQYLCPANANE